MMEDLQKEMEEIKEKQMMKDLQKEMEEEKEKHDNTIIDDDGNVKGKLT